MFSKAVTVVTDKKDRYGRDVGKVLVEGTDATLVQEQQGFARHYKAYEHEQSASDRKLYDMAESETRAAKRDLWRDADPLPPWGSGKQKVSPPRADFSFDWCRRLHGTKPGTSGYMVAT